MNRKLKILTKPFQFFYQKTAEDFKLVLAIDPIITNIMALSLCAGLLFILESKEFSPHLGKYHNIGYRIIQLLACYQVIKSAKKSLLLPLLTIIVSIAGILAHHYSFGFLVEIGTLQKMMLLGVIAAAVTIFYIP